MSIELLTQALQAAKAAANADKSNAQLKAAKKAAKAALAAAIAQQEAKAAKKAKKANKEAPPAPPAKKAKKAPPAEPTLDSLQAALASAKAAKKSLKNEETKAAFKAAKAALEAFQAKQSTETPKEETADAEEEPEDPENKPVPEDDLASLKKKGKKAAAAVSESGAEPNEKVFVGNLSWDVDDDGIKEFFKDCGSLTDIFWLTDKETQKFKGCGFLTFESTEAATKAVAKAGEDLLGRPIKIDFSKPKPGGDKGKGASKKGGKGGKKWEARPLSERPDGCTTVFCGNLSFDIDEEAMYKFAEGCGEVTSIRWLTDKASGDFKGCGFVEFDSPESVDKFVLKNGQEVAGRPIHIDYASKRPPKKEF